MTSQPPQTSAAPTTSLFGAAAQPTGLFGAKPATLTATPPAASPFGSNPLATTTAPAQTPSISFGVKPTEQSSTPKDSTGVFAATKPSENNTTAQPASSLFGAKPATTQPSSGSNLFGGGLKSTPTPAPATTGAAAPTAPSLFGSSGAAKPAASSSASGPSLFAGIGASTASVSQPAATTTAAPAASLFGGGFGGPTTKPSTETTSTAASAPQPAANTTGAINASTSTAPNAAMAASTAGPPAQHSRLKNKTMDEIIARWASDLSKYQKEFHDQASKVAQWDRLLVDNGAKIQTLYNSAYEAERASAEIERQISTVESQQDELSAWLDKYEAEVDEMHAKQVGSGDVLSGPDQERERTYKLAERLTEKLDEMSKDLGGMIEGMNEASSTLNRSSKADDPVSTSRPTDFFNAPTHRYRSSPTLCKFSTRICASFSGLTRIQRHSKIRLMQRID